jgi:hypothetical protein
VILKIFLNFSNFHIFVVAVQSLRRIGEGRRNFGKVGQWGGPVQHVHRIGEWGWPHWPTGKMVDGGGTLRDRQVALEPKSEDHVRGALA